MSIITNRNVGYGIRLNGSTQSITTANNVIVDLNTPISFSFHIAILGNTTPFDGIFSNAGGDSGIFCLVRAGVDYKIEFALLNNGASRFNNVSINQSLNLGEVYHIVFTKDSGFSLNNFKGYINGKDKSFYPSPFNALIASDNVFPQSNLRIGSIQTNVRANMILYDLKVYNKKLSPIEVEQQSIFNNVTDGLIHQYKFNRLPITDKVTNSPTILTGYNTGDKPLRDIQNTIVNNYVI